MRHSTIAILAAVALVAACCPTKDTKLARQIDDTLAPQVDSVFASVPLSGSVNEIHSLIVIKDGEIVAERYSPGQEADYLHVLWSASKTFTSTAVGFAVQEGLLNTSDKVKDFFGEDELPVFDDLPWNDGKKISAAQQQEWFDEMTVKDLLVMSSGLARDYLAALGAGVLEHPVRSIFEAGMAYEPGSRFSYNSMNAYILSAIITKVTGQKLADYLKPRFFEPLGINNYVWEESVEGYNLGGWGLHMTTESFAKAGLFYLQRGQWEDEQLLAAEWIDEASAVQIDTEASQGDPNWKAGYGYQIWRCTPEQSYRFDGAWGQFSFVFPDKNAVVAINAHTWGTGQLAAAVIKYIYPYL